MPQALFTTSFALLQGVMDVRYVATANCLLTWQLPPLAIRTARLLTVPGAGSGSTSPRCAERVLEIVLASLDEPRKPKPV